MPNSNMESVDDLLLPVRIMIGNNYGDPTESKLAKDWWNHYDKLKAALERREERIKVEGALNVNKIIVQAIKDEADPLPVLELSIDILEQQLKTLDGQENTNE